ncbi:hypothetical protein SADO_13468 [Salinisphaera dokdonensis CL-ES53]|uniref:Uncharacterized protein n=2 Tax=Salinisphaera TaxID=180541 RepID=A0ABV2B3Y1_9GAMM
MLRSSEYNDDRDTDVIAMSVNVEMSRSERTLALLGGARFVQLSARELGDPAKVRSVIREGLPVASAQYAREHSGVPNRLFD